MNTMRFWIGDRKGSVILADRNVLPLLTLAHLFPLGLLLTGLFPPHATAHSLEELEEKLKVPENIDLVRVLYERGIPHIRCPQRLTSTHERHHG